jgi:hypothetical protein
MRKNMPTDVISFLFKYNLSIDKIMRSSEKIKKHARKPKGIIKQQFHN